MNKAVSALQNIRGLRGPIAGILVLIVAMPLISLWAMYQIGLLSERVTAVDEARLQVSRSLRYTLDEETGLRGYVSTGDQLFLDPYRTAHPQIERVLRDLPATFKNAGLDSVQKPLNDMARLHEAWHANVANPLLANRRRPDALAIQEDGKKLVDRMRADVDVIQAQSAVYIQSLTQQMTSVQIMAGLLVVLWIAIVGIVTIVMERRTLRREMDLVLSLVAEREAVERLSDWRSRLLAMLAHDFKSQLSVIIGAAHLLEDFPQRRGDGQLLASVRDAGYALAEMADDAILMARAQEHRLMLQRTDFDVCEVIQSVVGRYAEKREFNLFGADYPARIDGDRSYVGRVLDNVIGNAVKYSERPVDVHISNGMDNVFVSVADRGNGIDGADLPHIFEEFWRSENATKNKKGSGVGLFIVKQIMEAHGGSVDVESEIGKGTTVTLCFQRGSEQQGDELAGSAKPDPLVQPQRRFVEAVDVKAQ